jgi:2-keto-4-pentenoate hydratase/2-oxohepta-3-ene-1,7-dioic acid hydratase in catechol pathway
VIGRPAERVAPAEAWSHVAGLAVGQDYSEREIQMVGPAPQFSLAKSFPGFGPIGPWLVTPDELDDPDDLELVCEINGEQVQKGRTSAMVWSLPDLISVLSGVCPLRPGDVIFTGTPAGVGMARKPPRFLAAGDVVVSRIQGIGEIRQECLAGN